MRASYRYLLISILFIGSLSTALSQPVWEAAVNAPVATGVSGTTPLLRREVRSLGLVVNLDVASNVYFAAYRIGNDPGVGAITAAALKAGTTPGTKAAFGSFTYGDGTYCTNVYPNNTLGQCAAALANSTRDRAISLDLLTSDTYVVYVVAEAQSAPNVFTAIQTRSLANNPATTSCFRVGSTTLGPAPVFAPSLSNNCSPATFNLTVGYIGVDFASSQTVFANVNFGDVSATGTDRALTLQNSPLGVAERNKAFRLYQVDLVNVYDYSSGDNPSANPTGSACTFLVDVEFNAAAVDCGTTPGGVDNSTTVTIWDRPNTARGLQDVNPNGMNNDDAGADDEEFEICGGDRSNINLLDNSVFNCTTIEDARNPLPRAPNREARWVQWVYGAPGTTVTTSGALNDQVTINGINFTAAQLPIYGPITYIPASIAANPNTPALAIRMPINAASGAVLMVEMRSWNTCLPYDSDVSDANGLNPVGGSFDLDLGLNSNNNWLTAAGAWPGNATTFPNASTTPITFQKPIVIVDEPAPPTFSPNPYVVCEEQPDASYLITLSSPVGAPTFNVYSNAALTTLERTDNTAPFNYNPATQGPNAFNKNNPGTYTRFATVSATVGNGQNCTSLPVTIPIVIEEKVVPGVIAHPGPLTICNGENPVAFTSTTPASGGRDGTPTYQWASATVSGGPYTDIFGATSITFDPPALTTTTFFVRRAISDNGGTAGVCASANSNEITFIVQNPVTGGSITGDLTVCNGVTNPPIINNSVLPTQGSGTYAFQWEISITSAVAGFSDIVGATANSFDPPAALTQTTWYRRRVNSGVATGACTGFAYSNVVQYTVDNAVVPGVIATAQVICSGGNPANLTSTSDATGGNGTTYTYQWQESTTSAVAGFNDILGATANTFDPPILTQTHWYKRIASSGACASQESNVLEITVNPLPTVASVTGGGAVCAPNPAPDIVFTFTGVAPFDFTIDAAGTPISIVNHPSTTFTIVGPTTGGNYSVTALNDNNNCNATSLGGFATVTIGGTAAILEGRSLTPAATCDDGASTTDPVLTIDVDGGALVGYTLNYTIDGGGNQSRLFNTNGSGVSNLNFDYVTDFGGTAIGHTLRLVSIVSPSGCLTAVGVDLPYTVNPRPAAPVSPGNVIACSDVLATTAVAVNNPGASLTVDWYAASTGGSVLAGGTGTITFTPGVAGTFHAETRNTTTGCISTTRTAVTLTSDPKPGVADAGVSFSVCDATATLAATAATNSGTGTWTSGNAIYTEPFPSADNNLGIVGPPAHATSFTHPLNKWSITLPANNILLDANDWLKVDGGRMSGRDLNNNQVQWQSSIIPFTGTVGVSIQMTEIGNFAGGDVLNVSHKIDGGAEVQFGQITGDLAIDGSMQTFTATGLTGSTIQIIVRLRNDGINDVFAFDNVTVFSGSGTPIFSDVNSPSSSVSNLQFGANNIRWTVTSLLGSCPATFEDIVITRNTLPVNVDPAPVLCEDVFGGAVEASVSLAFLNTLIPTITGGAGSRTVDFFVDAARTTPFAATIAYESTEQVFTRVTRTDVTPNCTQDGVITFTVNPKPVVTNLNGAVAPDKGEIQFCEDDILTPGIATGVDLTVFNNEINNLGGFTLTWHNTLADAAADVNAIAAANTTVNDGQNYTVRVENNATTCFNTADVVSVVNPLPIPNAIIGSGSRCIGDQGFYFVTPTANRDYQWTVPGVFTNVGGITTNFNVFLDFPGVVNPSQNISVIEIDRFTTGYTNVLSLYDASGILRCAGDPNTFAIQVDATPAPITIVGDFTLCENEVSTYEALPSNAPISSYDWIVDPPVAASIIIIPNTNRAQITATNQNFQLKVKEVAASCSGPEVFEVITVNPRPSLNDLSNTVCSDDLSSGLTLTGTGGSLPLTFNISNVDVQPGLVPPARATNPAATATEILNDTFNNLTGGNLEVNYTVVPISADGCDGPAKIVKLTVKPEPRLQAGLFDEICSTFDLVNITLGLAAGSAPADQFVVESINNPAALAALAGTPAPGTFTSTTFLNDDRWENKTGVNATIEYLIKPRNSASTCVGDPAIPVTVNVKPEPIVTPLPNDVICSGDTPTITLASTPAVGNSFAWTVGPVVGFITGQTNGGGATAIPDVLVNSGAGAGSVTYAVTATLNACNSQPQNITIDVNPAPTANNIIQTICSDVAAGNTSLQNLTALQPTINGGAVSFSWFEDLALSIPIGTPGAFTLTSGDPVFVLVDNTTCTKVAQVSFTINPTPSVTTIKTLSYNTFDVSCTGASDGQLTATPADGIGPYLFSINGGGTFFTSNVFNGLSAGASPYVIRTRDINGCIADSAPLPFTDPPPLTGVASKIAVPAYNGADISCQGASDGRILVTPGGGAGVGYTFDIQEVPSNSTGDASGTYIGLGQGTFTFIVKDGNNCQVVSNAITLIEPSAILPTAVLTTPVSCNGNADGVITVTATGGTEVVGNYSFTLVQPPNTNNATGVFNGLAFGSYTVTVQDDNGCSRISNAVNVTQPAVLTAFTSVTSNYNGSKISCAGAGDGQITTTANGGNGGYSYLLVQDNANITGQATGVFSGLTPLNYSVTVTDVTNCTVTTTLVNISEPLPVVAFASITNTISCNGDNDGEITISGTGGTGAYTFERVPGVFNASGIYPGLTQGNYTFFVRDLNNCFDDVNQLLTEPTLLTASAAVSSNYNGSQLRCNNTTDGEITVTAAGGTGALNYVFNQFILSNTTGAFGGVFSGVPAGTNYDFTVEDTEGCTVVTNTVSVVAPTPITVSRIVSTPYNGQQISCNGAADGEIQFSALGGTPVPAGVYTFRLDQDPLNTTGDAGGLYQNLASGIYTATVRDANNCSGNSVAATVTQPTALTISGSVTSNYFGQQITCFGASDGAITVSGGGGVPAYTFEVIETGTTQGALLFTGLAASTYTIRITDLNLCTKISAPITVSQPTALTATATVTSNYNGQQISCFNANDAIINVTRSGGTSGNANYLFVETAALQNSASNSVNFTGVADGPSYTFIVTDINNCVSPPTTAVSVTEPPQLIVTASVTSNYNGQNISCFNANDAVITVTQTVATGTGTAEYSFDQFPANQTGKFSGVFTAVEDGVNYTFTGEDVNGCLAVSNTVTVTEPLAINAAGTATSNFNGFDISCFNETDGELTVVPVTGGTAPFEFTLLENPGNLTGQLSGIFTSLRAGTYRVRIADVNGCLFTTVTTPVVQPADLVIKIKKGPGYNGFDVSCDNATDGSIELDVPTTGGTGAGTYNYVLDQDLLNVSGNGTGTYTTLAPNQLFTVTVTDANTCTKTSLPVLLIAPLPLFEGVLGFDDAICIGQGDPDAFVELAAAFGGVNQVDKNYGYQWQESPDGVTFANIAGETNKLFDAPTALATTTFYRRQITSGTCAILFSNPVKVTVNPLPTVVDFSTPISPVCEGEFFIIDTEFTGTAPFFFDYTDRNDETAVVTNVSRIGADVTPIPIFNHSYDRSFTLTQVRDFNGCIINPNLSFTVPVSRINPNFTIVNPTPICDGDQFTFQWTVATNVEYTWLWPDGTQSVIAANSLPNGLQTIPQTFVNNSTTSSSNLPIILTAINNVDGCGPKQSNQAVTVRPKILLNVFPDKTVICSEDAITFSNPSQGLGSHTWTVFEQGDPTARETRVRGSSTNEVFNLENASTSPIQNPELYDIVYTVTNGPCSESITTPITVYRGVTADFTVDNVSTFVLNNATVNLTNTSDPLDGTNFSYDWDFGLDATPATLSSDVQNIVVNYSDFGSRDIVLSVRNTSPTLPSELNGCASAITKTITILLAPLVADFDVTPLASCLPVTLEVNYDNIPLNDRPTGDVFEWEVLDEAGQVVGVSSINTPSFEIFNQGTYTVVLRNSNSVTAQFIFAEVDEIEVFPLPIPAFQVRPAVVFVPDQELTTFNFSEGANLYMWDFGDGTTSQDFEPKHKYRVEGEYPVELIAGFDNGNRDIDGDGVMDGNVICYDTVSTTVQAKDGGVTKIPNSFTPSPNGPNGGNSGNGSFNDVFLPITKGVEEFQMQIFDRWGTLVFESRDKNQGWDGYDRNGNALPSGVYVYKLVLRLSNGERTTQVGDVTLIR
jgi:gliding motility-associated-like protein